MKTWIPFIVLLTICIDAIGQTRVLPPTEFRNVYLPDAPAVDLPVIKNTAKGENPGTKSPNAEAIGSTFYDLQSNASMQNRIFLYPDGFIGGTFTYGMDLTNFTDRGTGYNQYDGDEWGSWPVERIESDRCGWPSYVPWGENGEAVVAHYSGAATDGLVLSRREDKGTGTWTELNFIGPDDHSLLWPRMVSSGPDHDVLHLLALTTPSINGGSLYQGQNGALVYSRSSDGGTTWEIENEIIDGIGSAYYPGFNGDTYEFAYPRGETRAILIGDEWTDLILLKSTDSGDTWEKTIVWEHPYPYFDPGNPTVTDTFYCPDGAHSLVIDSEGKVHIVFGIFRAYSDGGGTYWFPLVDGIGYWNEDMAPFSNNLNALSPYGDPGSELIEDYNLIGWMQDIDGNGELDILDDVAAYYLGASSMPQLVVDELDHLFCVYSSLTEFYDQGVQTYRHLWLRARSNEGGGWGDFFHLTSDLVYIFSECVFPSCSPVVDDHMHLLFQEDNEPGLATRGDLDPYGENYIQYFEIPVEGLIPPPVGNVLSGTVTKAQSGGAVSNAEVSLQGTSFATFTNIAGHYTLSNIPSGTYIAKCNKEGYFPDSATVVINDFAPTYQDFALSGIVVPDETDIGDTRYDLQSNAGMQNRFHYYEDGSMGAVWTMGQDDPAFPDRGTGYAYYTGATWDPVFPEERIESIRTGWPSYMPYGPDGEMVVSHDFSEGELVLLSREEKGTDDWSELVFEGPDNQSISWNRSISSGPDKSVLHILSLTWPTSSGGSLYEGLDGAITYSRTADGGLSWEEEHTILDGMTATDNTGFPADVFEWAAPQGNRLAFLVGNPWTDLFVMESDDGGESWSKMGVWEHPYPMFDPSNPTVTDTFYCPDGAHHIAFDNNGDVHVVFGITRVWADAGSTYFEEEVDGIGYWNESLPTFSNNLNALSPYGDPGSELVEDETLIGWVQDVNGNGQLDLLDEWGDYYLGMSSMPQLVIDENNNRFLVFSSLAEIYDNGIQNYRHIWVRGYHSGTGTWGDFFDLNTDISWTYGECVFPSVASFSDEYIHLIFMDDPEPGLAVRGDMDDYTENTVIYTNVLKSQLLSPEGFGNLVGQVINQANGNALSNANVAIEGTSFSTTTNLYGNYTIEDIPSGTYTANCSKSGFVTTSATVVISASNNTLQNFQLLPTNPTGEVIVGATMYDLQSNSGMQNRIWAYSDGTVGVTWTMGFDFSGFPDRGTGYNYYNGGTWNPFPTAAIESDRSGWPSYTPWGENGEMVVSHYSGASTDGLVINSRPEKGTGDWSSINFYGPDDQHPYLWPRSAAGGVEHDVFHLIALTMPVSNGGTIYEGMDGALLYSRSFDGGQTWDQAHVLLEGINNNYYWGFSTDSYEIQASGERVAFLAGDEWTGLVLMKSSDGGDTWEKTVVWEHPYPMLDPNAPFPTDTFYCADGSHALSIGPDGKVHIAFGISRNVHDGFGMSWFPEVDGIGYWNEDRPTFSNDLNALSPYGDPGSELVADYSLVGWSQDVNGNGQLDLLDYWGQYYCGLSSMPQLVVDQWNRVFLVYSSVTETYDNGIQNYRHLWARGSSNNGDFWGEFEHLTSDLIYIFSECVFPSVSQRSDDYLYLVFQEDPEPGMAIRGDLDPYTDNQMVFMAVEKVEPIGAAGNLAGTVTDIYSGDPIEGATVSLGFPNFSTTVGETGEFLIPGIPVGNYNMLVTAMGYYNTGGPVAIEDGETTVVEVYMAPADDLYPPQNLEAEAIPPEVMLSWDPPILGLPQHYNVYRDGEKITSINQLTYTDPDVEPGMYEYFVTAQFPDGESGPSNIVVVYAPEPCFAPQNVAATVTNGNLLVLTWDPSVNGNELSYNIYRDWVFIANVAGSSVYYDELQPGEYVFCITSVCEEGESEPACADPVTIVPVYPAPWGLEVSFMPADSMLLVWQEPEDEKSWFPMNDSVLGYNVFISFNGGAYGFLEFTDETEYTTELVAWGEHCYYVTAVYESGESEGCDPDCDVPVGLPGLEQTKVQLFPNPADEKVFIKTQQNIKKITVFNVTGNILFDAEIEPDQSELNVSEYPPGIYLFRIELSSEIIKRRVVIQ